MSTSAPDEAKQLQRLSVAVKARIHELRDRTDVQIHALGGPSSTTMTKIREARRPVPRKKTLEALDSGLEWEPGSAWRVVHRDEQPTPAVSAGDAARRVLALAPEPARGGPLRRLVEIRDELDQVIAQLRAE